MIVSARPPLRKSFSSQDLFPGDIVWVEILAAESRGHEQTKRRPWVIVSAPHFHRRNLGLVIAVPCTSKLEKQEGYRGARIRIPESEIEGDESLKGDQLALTEHVRSISIERIQGRAGCISAPATVSALRAAIAHLLDIDCDQ